MRQDHEINLGVSLSSEPFSPSLLSSGLVHVTLHQGVFKMLRAKRTPLDIFRDAQPPLDLLRGGESTKACSDCGHLEISLDFAGFILW